MTSVLGCSRPSLPPPLCDFVRLVLRFSLCFSASGFCLTGTRACAEGCAVGVCQSEPPLGGLMSTCAGSSSKVGKSWMQIPPVLSQSPEIIRGARCAGCCGIVVRIADACMHRMQLEKRDYYIVSENGTEIKQTTNGVGLNKMFLMCEHAAAAPKQHRLSFGTAARSLRMQESFRHHPADPQRPGTCSHGQLRHPPQSRSRVENDVRTCAATRGSSRRTGWAAGPK